MTDADWGLLSDQAVAAAAVVYFLALLTHLAEWASLRTPVTARAEAGVVVGAVSAAPGARPRRRPIPTGEVGSRSSVDSG